MKECELCSLPARMFCESDQASLCLKCDSKVHSANFLVARHSRTLLCQSCQSLTPWQASGSKLGPTLTVCERCVAQCNARKEEQAEAVEEEEADETDNDEDEDIDDESDDGDDGNDDDDSGDIGNGNGNEDEEDGENQVVPWTSSSSTTQPPQPPMASSSSSEDSSSSRFYNMTSSSLKRNREHVGIGSQDELCSSSSQLIVNGEDFIRSTKDRKRALNESKSVTIINSVKRFEKKLISPNNEKMILGICNLSEDCSRSVDLVSNDSPSSPI